MSRDSTGNYTSPSGPFVSGTIINSSVMNQKLTDLGDEITNSLDRNGKGDMLAPILVPDGTNNLPGYGFSSEATLGFWRAATGQINATSNGTALQKWSTTEVRVYNAFKVSAGGAVIDAGGLTVTAGGLTVTAGNTTLGGGVTGPSSGALVVGNGLTVTVGGVTSTGATTGNGGTFTGGATSGSGVVATSTGGSTAVVGTGGGTNAKGAEFTSTGTAVAVTATASAAGGYGLVATGGTDTAGVVAQSGTAATATTPQAALTCANGYITFGSTVSPNSDVSLANTLAPSNIAKAWGTVSITSGGVATLNAGFNITSVSDSAGDLTVTFAQDFSTVNYMVLATVSISGTVGGTAYISSRSPGFCVIRALRTSDNTLVTATAHVVDFVAFGVQP